MTIPFFTNGGLFYWVDKHSYAGWRIQESTWMKRCRLLDKYNIRRQSGSFEDCFYSLNMFLKQWEEPPVKRDAVVFIHGLYQSSAFYEKISHSLAKDYELMTFSYPTLRYSLIKSAMALNAMLERRDDIRQINFVVMGVGGLILRQAIALNPKWLRKIGRSVFLSVPNKGYEWAEKYKDNKVYQFLFGAMAEHMTTSSVESLQPMGGEFCTITGGKGDEKGFVSRFQADNDMLMRVSSSQVDNAKENYLALNKTHFFLHKDNDVFERIQNFLATGRIGKGVRLKKEKKFTNIWDE